MQTASLQSRRLGDYTSTPFEIFIAAFSVLPFLVLAYFYPSLPERVPMFLNLSGEVETWAGRGVLTVFRVPLMAVDTQLVCLLMKYGTVKSEAFAPHGTAEGQADGQRPYLKLWTGLWDCLRCLVALKMSASSLDTVFLSLERFRFLARPAFAVTAVAALLSVACAMFYGYRLLVLRRGTAEKFGHVETRKPVDARRVYGGVVYFNPADPAPFARTYIFNFGNKWTWAFIACLVAYPLLVFLPA